MLDVLEEDVAERKEEVKAGSPFGVRGYASLNFLAVVLAYGFVAFVAGLHADYFAYRGLMYGLCTAICIIYVGYNFWEGSREQTHKEQIERAFKASVFTMPADADIRSDDESGEAVSTEALAAYSRLYNTVKAIRRQANIRSFVTGLFLGQFLVLMWMAAGSLLLEDNKLLSTAAAGWEKELLANMAHAFVIVLGLLGLHHAFKASQFFFLLSDRGLHLVRSLHLREQQAAESGSEAEDMAAQIVVQVEEMGPEGLQEVDKTVKEVKLHREKALLNFATSIRELWTRHASVVDLVDCTDFFLLLVESDLFSDAESSHPKPSTEWYIVFAIWAAASITTLLFDQITRMTRKLPQLPDGLNFWLAYLGSMAFRTSEEFHDLRHEGHWRFGQEDYKVFITKSKNKHTLVHAVQSLIFIETPFLLTRVTLSLTKDIMSSSLLIKNVLSFIYDMYIVVTGLGPWWRGAYETVDDVLIKEGVPVPLIHPRRFRYPHKYKIFGADEDRVPRDLNDSALCTVLEATGFTG